MSYHLQVGPQPEEVTMCLQKQICDLHLVPVGIKHCAPG